MKTKTKFYLGISLLALLLFAVFLLLKDGEKGVKTYPISTYPIEDIHSLSVKKGEDTLVFEQRDEGYRIGHLPLNIPLIQSDIFDLFAKVSDLIYTDIIHPTGEKKEDYGLSNPTLSITLTSKKEETITIFVGDSYFDKEGTYFSLTGREEIFGIRSRTYFEDFLPHPYDYIDKVIYPQNKGVTLSQLEKVTLSSPEGKVEYVKNTDNPIPDRLKQLPQLSGSKVLSLFPTEEELKTYGFAQPVEVTYQINSVSYTLTIGKEEGGLYPVLSQGHILYQIAESTLGFLKETEK